jgi:hypothetical protein
MATFLELVKALARDSGTVAGGVGSIQTLLGASGRVAKLAGWTADAYLKLQSDRPDWPWMVREFSTALTIGQQRYSANDLSLARFGRWVNDRPDFHVFTLYDPAVGKCDESDIHQSGYDVWRSAYGRGTHDPDRPRNWSVDPQSRLCFGPVPDKAYELSGEYRASPQVLAVDADVPEMPAEYHRAIVWEAWKLMCQADGDDKTIPQPIAEYALLREKMDRDYLPEIAIGGDGGYFGR